MSVESAVFAERVHTLYDNLLTGQLMTAIVATAVAMIAQSTAGTPLAWGWLAAMIAAILGRAFILRAYRKSPHQADQARFWHRMFLAGLGAVCLLWIAGILMFVPGLEAGGKNTMLMILVGMTAGAVPVLGCDRSAFLLYASALMLPTSIALALNPDVHQILLAVLGVAYFVAMLVVANRYFLTLSQSLTLAFHNAKLIEDIDVREQRNAEKMKALHQALTASRTESDKLVQSMRSEVAFSGQRTAFLLTTVADMQTVLQTIRENVETKTTERAGSPEPGQILTAIPFLLGKLGSVSDLCDLGTAPAVLVKTTFCPGTALKLVVAYLDPLAQQQRCNLTAMIDPALPKLVIGDQVRFNQIVATMAFGMTRICEGSDIKIDARIISRTAEQVVLRLSVCASPGSAQPEILEAAQRLLRQNEIRGSKFQDAALIGIQTARRWVEAMNGRITVELADQPEPSCLWAELRLEQPQASPAPQDPP